MKPWFHLVIGWVVFLVGHSAVITIRARELAWVMTDPKHIRFSESTYRTADWIIVGLGVLVIATGTIRCFQRTSWKYLLVPVTLILQAVAGVVAWYFLCIYVHLGVGGPL